jgi:hypothetical protein
VRRLRHEPFASRTPAGKGYERSGDARRTAVVVKSSGVVLNLSLGMLPRTPTRTTRPALLCGGGDGRPPFLPAQRKEKHKGVKTVYDATESVVDRCSDRYEHGGHTSLFGTSSSRTRAEVQVPAPTNELLLLHTVSQWPVRGRQAKASTPWRQGVSTCVFFPLVPSSVPESYSPRFVPF